MTHTYPDWETCELPRRAVDPTLPQPGWRFYQPVDLLRVFKTPDGVGRTLHAGVYQTREDAIEASGVEFDAGQNESTNGSYRIQPVST